MQQEPIPNKIDYPLQGKFAHSNDEYFIPIKKNFLTLQHNLPISTGNNAQLLETTDSLVSRGKQLALSLAETLSRLKVRDKSAIYPIITILEPFFEVTELDLHVTPIGSAVDNGRHIAYGTGQPEVNNVREESFFRFLDELEAGVYSADDATAEE